MTPDDLRAIPDPAERFKAVNAELNPDRDRQRELAAIARESVRELRARGWSWGEIGERFGISRQRALQLGGHQEKEPT